MSEYGSGDVAMVTAQWRRGVRETAPAVLRADGWERISDGAFAYAGDTLDARPLAVIDPKDKDQVARLADLFCAARWSHVSGSDECDPLTRSSMQTALDNYLKAPLAEPTAKYAVVVDVEGNEWVRLGNGPAPWMLNGSPSNRDTYPWFGIIPARVLSDGIAS